MTTPDSDLLRQFTADETESFAQKRQGKFWPRNHHRLRPLSSRAGALLGPAEYEDFLFHLMRVTGSAPSVAEKHIPALLDAYRRLIPHLDIGGVIQMARRHEMLFLFGFDDSGSLADGTLASTRDLKARLKLLAQIGAYTSQPAQRDKAAKFLPFAGDAGRILQTLRHLGYHHDRRYGEDLYDITCLGFWGMIFIALLSSDTRPELLGDLTGDQYRLVRRDEQLAMLHRYVAAIAPDVPQGEERFHDLARHLAVMQAQRREATETVALARALGLSFAGDEGWEITIALPLRGSAERPLIARNVLHLHLRPDPDWQWQVSLRLVDRGQFTETERKIIRNDLELTGLGAGGLHRFPDWLHHLRDKGMDFDVAAAEIRVGRHRAATKLIATWLGA